MNIKKLLKKILASRNLALINLNSNRALMDCAFQGIKNRGHEFQTVIDIGASDGRWSADLMQYFPDKKYLLIEAQHVHEEGLQRFSNNHENAAYCLAAAGDKEGTLYFDASNPFGGQASYAPYDKSIEVPVITLDDEVEKRNLSGPFLIKFDTHGFEIPILNGAKNILAETEVVIMECYNFKIAPECLTFDEMIPYMRKLGFRSIDLVDPIHRPHDGSFWQMDLVFVRENRPEFEHLKYQ